MSKNSVSPFEIGLKIQINNLVTIYEQKAECGIFFKINPEKSPLEILGVLDFLKNRIRKWGNLNLFSYHGNLFSRGDVLVVGSRDLEEALSIISYMYLTNIIKKESGIDILKEKMGSSSDLELFLRKEISDNIENGYPSDPNLEVQLLMYLKNMMQNDDEKMMI